MSASKNVLNVDYSIWRMNIRSHDLILPKIFYQWNEEEKADNAAVCLAICSDTKMAKFLLTHAQCTKIMYELDSTRQIFDVLTGVAFLLDNATRLVERAEEVRQPIQRSNFCQIIKLNLTRQKCDVWTGPNVREQIPEHVFPPNGRYFFIYFHAKLRVTLCEHHWFILIEMIKQ